MILKSIITWVPMVIIAVANGALRELTYGKRLSELRAHQLSTVMGLTLLGIYIFYIMRYLNPASVSQSITVGFIWLTLTMGFEFVFGHFVRGLEWKKLFKDYNLLAGRIWPLILAWITIAPYLFYLGLNK